MKHATKIKEQQYCNLVSSFCGTIYIVDLGHEGCEPRSTTRRLPEVLLLPHTWKRSSNLYLSFSFSNCIHVSLLSPFHALVLVGKSESNQNRWMNIRWQHILNSCFKSDLLKLDWAIWSLSNDSNLLTAANAWNRDRSESSPKGKMQRTCSILAPCAKDSCFEILWWTLQLRVWLTSIDRCGSFNYKRADLTQLSISVVVKKEVICTHIAIMRI